MVRRRAHRLRGDDRLPARLPRARALPLHDRARRHRAAAAAARARHRRAGQRRVPRRRASGRSRSSPPSWRRSASSSSSRATCATRARCVQQKASALKDLGPLLVVWGASMLLLVFIRDLGSSLMFFGAFLALVYVATNRISFVAIGLGDVRRRRGVLHEHRRPRAGPHRRVAGPVRPRAVRGRGRRQLPDRPVAVRAGRRRAVRHRLRPGAARPARRQRGILPAAETDLIYALITNELGLLRARPRSSASTCSSPSAASRSRCSPRTRSPSCWPPA